MIVYCMFESYSSHVISRDKSQQRERIGKFVEWWDELVRKPLFVLIAVHFFLFVLIGIAIFEAIWLSLILILMVVFKKIVDLLRLNLQNHELVIKPSNPEVIVKHEIPMHFVKELGQMVRICCYQSARVQESYCLCGKVVPSDLHRIFDPVQV